MNCGLGEQTGGRLKIVSMEKLADGNLKKGQDHLHLGREEQPQSPGHAGGCLAGKQPCRKGPGGPGGHQPV